MDTRLRRLLPWLGLFGAVAAGGLVWMAWPKVPVTPRAVEPPPPAPVVIVQPAPVVMRPVSPPPQQEPEIQPEPPVAPAPQPAAPRFQVIVLADGRTFIGTLDAAGGMIQVQASVRGGTMTPMPTLSIRVDPAAVVSRTDYDGRWGALTGGFTPPPPDPARVEALAGAREAAAVRAEHRRQEAAEQERLHRLAAQRVEAERRVAMLRDELRTAMQREQQLAVRARTLEDDRRLKLELINGLQLQLNAAQDRWNLDVQTLGPRVTKPDGTVSGGPTLATETLLLNIQQQIRNARQAVANIEATMRDEAAERQRLGESLPAKQAEIQAATEALAALTG